MSASALFDVPGPKARLRHRIYLVVSLVAVVGALAFVVNRFNDTGQFNAKKWQVFQYAQVQRDLLAGLVNTLKAFGLGATLALVFATVFAAGRLSDHRLLRIPSRIVVELFRAIPLVIMIFLLYYGVNDAKHKLISLGVGLMLYNGSVLAEVFRAGITAVPRGQSEAAYALGMRKTQVMFTILLPQAIRTMLPTVVSQLVVVMKDTALGYLILYDELLDQGKDLFDDFQFERPVIPVSIVIALIYITMCSVLSVTARMVEQRMRRSGRVVKPVTVTVL
ncbi:MAG: amino acid ABC transporter permease [Ilumatobacteraceae bacterium]